MRASLILVAMSLLTPVLGQSSGPASAPQPAPIQQDSSTRIVPVPDDATIIEAQTLLPNARLGGATQVQGKAYTGPNNKLLGAASGNAPPQVTASGVGPQRHDAGFVDPASTDQSDLVTAMRLYGFTLQPNEEIAFKMTSESHTRIRMRLGEPLVGNAMTAPITAVNRKPKPIRATGFAVKNVLPDPYQLILIVYGEAGYKYRIDIQRKIKS